MRAWLVFVLLVSGCYPDPGDCDRAAAGEIVYDANGNPAFAGQALMIQSCGGGSFCHADTLDGVDPEDEAAVAEAVAARHGAPGDLNFDLRLATTTSDVNADAHLRLRGDQQRVVTMAGQVLWQVQTGAMPPGDEGDTIVSEVRSMLSFDRVMDDGVTFVEMPGLGEEAGEEILRNWLACGAPVVERSVLGLRLPDELSDATGFEIASCDRDCIDVRWPAIYEQVIEPTCAGGECHDSTDSAAQLDLTGGAMAAYVRIIDEPAQGRQCGLGMSPPSIVDSMVADDSLLLQKLEASSSDEVCGTPMPLVGNQLGAQRLCVIRAWVECGACPEADGGTCAACLDAARSTCNYDSTAANGCSVSDPCPNSYEL